MDACFNPYLEVESDEGKYEALEVLDEVVEDAQPFRVIALLHVQQRPDLGALTTRSTRHERKENTGRACETQAGGGCTRGATQLA